MGKWTFTQARANGGWFQVVFSAPSKGQAGGPTDVTYFRNTPVQVHSYSSGDPFGDAVASLAFPQITGFDDMQSGELEWLGDFSNVDIYYVPPDTVGTEVVGAQAGALSLDYTSPNAIKVWEGFVASIDYSASGSTTEVNVSCQGALYQADKYLSKPLFPARPKLHEALLADVFNTDAHPHMRTKKLVVEWPAGWTKTQLAILNPTIYDPTGATPGQKITGYSTRQTGSWDRSLTAFAQDLLAVMFVDETSGVIPGNQWTIRKDPNRQPVLYVRDRFKATDFTIIFGTPGMDFRLTRDATQFANVIYAEGTAVDGAEWRNAAISDDGTRTDYIPIAFWPKAYPAGSHNPNFNMGDFVSETFIKYGNGFSQIQAEGSAAQTLARDLDPGYTGEIEMSIDPSGSMSRYQIKAGMNIRLTHFGGSGDDGLVFHVAEVTCNPMEGRVILKVDTKFRDLLTLEEAVARTRDPLTPSKMLQINRRTLLIEDRLAPWDYNAGSGFIPSLPLRQSFFRDKDIADPFPWRGQVNRYHPIDYPQFYVKVEASADTARGRWACGFPILMSEKGTIRRLELAAYTAFGDPCLVGFHFSIYRNKITPDNMPFDPGMSANDPNFLSPWIANTFQSIDASTGAPLDGAFAPDEAYMIGWGSFDQRAGYSPGSYDLGHPPTGLLIDDANWQFDMTTNPEFDRYASIGTVQLPSTYSAYGAIYCEFTEPVYFVGRMYRAEPGT